MDYKDAGQFSHDMIFTSGAIGDYPWWLEAAPMHKAASDGTVPSYWGYRVRAVNQGDEDAQPIEVEVFHDTLIRAIDRICNNELDEGADIPEGLYPVDEKTKQHCLLFQEDPQAGAMAFDGWTADEVLQVIVYGGING